MEECCGSQPKIFCNVCRQGACEKHLLEFKRNHPPEKMLSPSGREMFSCGRVPVTFFLDSGIVILMSPGEIYRRLRENEKK